MSERPEDNEEQASGPLGGGRLRHARRDNDISVRDIAKELHLDERKVRALEDNDFEVLGAPVFAKGHLRKYAELVGVPVDDVLADYYQMNRSSGAPPVVGPRRRQRREIDPLPWIVGVLLVGLVAAASWWWISTGQEVLESSSTQPATLAPFESTTTDDSDTAPEEEVAADSLADDAGGDAAADEELVIERAPLITEPVASAPTADDVPQVTIELTFSGDCWTEVTDANGDRLFYDLGSAGRTVTVAGAAPLRVILGDGDNVSISVDGVAYRIPASARRGRLARLTIDRP